MKLKQYWKELRRRHVVKAGIAYLVVAWLLIQVLDILLDAFQLGPGWMQTAIITLSIGFPIWLVLAWVYDFSWGSIQKTEDVPFDEEVSRKRNLALNRVIIGGLTIAVILLAANTLRLANKIELEEDGRLTLAVLPFDNFSPDPENEWIGDGITEDLLLNLANIDDFRIISRPSIMKYKELDQPIPEICQVLGTSYIVRGSVRQEGDEILVTAQLVSDQDDHIWGDRFRIQGGKILDVQADVAAKVTEVLLGELTPSQKEALETQRSIDPEAQRLLTLGDRLHDRMTSRHNEEAVEYYTRVVELEPQWEPALSRLARMSVWSNPTKGDSLASKALELNPRSDQAWAAKGIAYIKYNRYDEAEAILLRAVNTIQDAPWCHDTLASHYLFRKPDYEKALYHANQAAKVDPLNLYFIRRQIFVLIYLERFDEVDRLMRERKLFIDEEIQKYTQRIKIGKMAEVAAREAQDHRAALEIFERSIDTLPSESAWYRLKLATAYNKYFNNDLKFLEEIQQAWLERETIRNTPAGGPHELAPALLQALVENGKLDEAGKFMASTAYLNAFENQDQYPSDRSQGEWAYAIARKDFQSAESMAGVDVQLQLLTDVHAGRYAEVYANLEEAVYANPTIRARVFAVMNEPDSVFHYLNQETIDAPYVNSSPEFDSYRRDPRFITFREKYFLEDVSIRE